MTWRTALGAVCGMALLGVYLAQTAPAKSTAYELARRRAHQRDQSLLDRAEALTRRIVPGARAVTIELEHLGGGRQAGICEAVCRDQDGSELMRSTWRTDTGELVAASRAVVPAIDTLRIDCRAAAVGTAWGWAQALDMVEMNGSWRTERVIHSRTDCWGCTYRSGDRRVYVQITPAGAFVMAVASRPANAPAPPVVARKGLAHSIGA